MATEKQMIPFAVAKEYVEANYPNDPLLRTVAGSLLEALPKVDAVEVKPGRWIRYHEADIGWDEYGVRCSNCGFEVEDDEVKFSMNYCPNCGAKMGGENSSEIPDSSNNEGGKTV